MALLKLPGAGSKPTVEIDKRVELQINRKLSDKQTKEGVVAKVQVRHPAFSVIATVWNKSGRKYVTVPQQESNKGGQWYTLINLNKEFRDYILYMVENEDTDSSAWYMDTDTQTINYTFGDSNPDLGIESIVADGNLTYNQVRAGMICKVNLVTTIGSVFSYTIWNSKFGQSLYGTAPTEGDADNDNTAYRLTREATKQVLRYLHSNIDWTKTKEVPPVVAPQAAAVTAAEGSTESTTAATNPPAFTPVDDDKVLNAVQ